MRALKASTSIYSSKSLSCCWEPRRGKSTLLNILGGLDAPSAGTLTYRDDELTDADDRALTRFRREAVGFIFSSTI